MRSRSSLSAAHLFVLCAALGGSSAWAQVRALPAFELDPLAFNPSQHEGLVLGSAGLLPAGRFRASLGLQYQHDPLVYLVDGQRVGSVVKSRLSAHLLAAYGITRWLEVGLQLPVVLVQRGDSVPDLAAPQGAGLSTPWLHARVGFLSEASAQPLDLGLSVALGLPVGSAGALGRDSTVSVVPRLEAGRRLGLLRLGAQAGVLIRGGNTLSPESSAVSDELGSQLLLGASGATTNPGLRGEVSLLARVPFTRAPASVELLAGARYPLGPVELFALLGPGFGRAPGTPAFRAMLGMALGLPREVRCAEGGKYDPKECPHLDLDGDGVPNGTDACVDVAGRSAHRGCPPPDTDHDGVPDDDDACPHQRGPRELEGCPDTDQDTLSDRVDACPNVPGPTGNVGCPWPDTDGDGVLDPQDGCANQAGPRENKGCPWPDTDSDGLTDELDRCAQVAGPPENHGCPWPDTDQDGVIDLLDNCPHEPGPADNQGCPKAKKQLVVITSDKLVIKEKVFFDTGKATIQKRSFRLLDQVAAILQLHAELEMVKVEGHTDSAGSAQLNRKLSQARAESVRAYLVKKGVAPERLEAHGWGPDRPAQSNSTPLGREANRRVEFIVVHPEPKKIEATEVQP